MRRLSVFVLLLLVLIPGCIPRPRSLYVQAISDGSGGAIIAWQDGNGIHAQRLDPEGKPRWTNGGVLVCESPGTFDAYGHPQFTLTADAMGGAIVTWEDRRNVTDNYNDPAYNDPIPVYSQRISGSGELLWGAGTATGNIVRYGGSFPPVIPDGTGGAIFAWNNYRTYFRGLHDDFLRLQKLDPQGRPLWGKEGVLVTASPPYRPLTAEEIASGLQGTVIRSWPTYEGYQDIIMAGDGTGDIVVFWVEQGYIYVKIEGRVCAQRVDGAGNPVWPDRVVVAEGQYHYYSPSAVSDGAGGTIVAAIGESGAGGASSVNLQRVSDGGGLLWPDLGILVSMGYRSDIISDGLGGVILHRSEGFPPIGLPTGRWTTLYLQRLDQNGKALWQVEPLFTPEKGQVYDLALVADGTGGVIAASRPFQDFDHGPVSAGKVSIHRLDAEGNILFPEGIPVFTDAELQYQGRPAVVSDGSGGAIVIAAAGKAVLLGDMVYAQRVDANGNRLWGDGIRVDQ